MTRRGNTQTDGEPERALRDRFVWFGMVFALLLARSLTASRVKQAACAVAIGVAAYFIPPRPKRNFVVYTTALLIFAGCWATWDRIWGGLHHIVWRR